METLIPWWMDSKLSTKFKTGIFGGGPLILSVKTRQVMAVGLPGFILSGSDARTFAWSLEALLQGNVDLVTGSVEASFPNPYNYWSGVFIVAPAIQFDEFDAVSAFLSESQLRRIWIRRLAALVWFHINDSCIKSLAELITFIPGLPVAGSVEKQVFVSRLMDLRQEIGKAGMLDFTDASNIPSLFSETPWSSMQSYGTRNEAQLPFPCFTSFPAASSVWRGVKTTATPSQLANFDEKGAGQFFWQRDPPFSQSAEFHLGYIWDSNPVHTIGAFARLFAYAVRRNWLVDKSLPTAHDSLLRSAAARFNQSSSFQGVASAGGGPSYSAGPTWFPSMSLTVGAGSGTVSVPTLRLMEQRGAGTNWQVFQLVLAALRSVGLSGVMGTSPEMTVGVGQLPTYPSNYTFSAMFPVTVAGVRDTSNTIAAMSFALAGSRIPIPPNSPFAAAMNGVLNPAANPLVMQQLVDVGSDPPDAAAGTVLDIQPWIYLGVNGEDKIATLPSLCGGRRQGSWLGGGSPVEALKSHFTRQAGVALVMNKLATPTVGQFSVSVCSAAERLVTGKALWSTYDRVLTQWKSLLHAVKSIPLHAGELNPNFAPGKYTKSELTAMVYLREWACDQVAVAVALADFLGSPAVLPSGFWFCSQTGYVPGHSMAELWNYPIPPIPGNPPSVTWCAILNSNYQITEDLGTFLWRVLRFENLVRAGSAGTTNMIPSSAALRSTYNVNTPQSEWLFDMHVPLSDWAPIGGWLNWPKAAKQSINSSPSGLSLFGNLELYDLVMNSAFRVVLFWKYVVGGTLGVEAVARCEQTYGPSRPMSGFVPRGF